jgi:hypothetical protein
MLALCASDAVDDCVVFMVLSADIQKIESDLKNKPPTVVKNVGGQGSVQTTLQIITWY